MDPYGEVLKKIDNFISELSKPLSAEEIKNGWAENSQKVILEFFRGLKERVVNGERVGNIHVSRRLDSWGILEGALLGFAEEIGQEMENLGYTDAKEGGRNTDGFVE